MINFTLFSSHFGRWRPRRLKFSVMNLIHLVPWPDTWIACNFQMCLHFHVNRTLLVASSDATTECVERSDYYLLNDDQNRIPIKSHVIFFWIFCTEFRQLLEDLIASTNATNNLRVIPILIINNFIAEESPELPALNLSGDNNNSARGQEKLDETTPQTGVCGRACHHQSPMNRVPAKEKLLILSDRTE